MGQLLNRIKNISKARRAENSPNIATADFDILVTQSDNDSLTRLINEASVNSESRSSYHDDNAKQSNGKQSVESYRILGISANADLSKIKVAYKNQIKKYHPDLYHASTDSERSDADQKTAAINAAYDYLLQKKGL